MRKTKLGAAAMMAALALGASQAHAAAFASTDTAPMWWGSAGNHADLVFYYDSAAPKRLTIVGFYVLQVGGASVSQGLVSCGTSTSQGQILQPGGYCFVRATRSSGSVVGRIVATDGSNAASNFSQFMHGSLEIRDASDNTISRSETK